MPYVYQIFGNFNCSEEDLLAISNNARSGIDEIEGIIQRYLMTNSREEVASTMYVCRDEATALRVQKEIRDIMVENDGVSGFSTEFIFQIADSDKYDLD